MLMRFAPLFWICVLVLPVSADEGMWPFNQIPKDAINQKYKFDVSSDFLDNLRLASVHIGNGSGSFVSPTGLLLTNQHIVSGCLSQDSAKAGFYAADRSGEIRCPGLEASVLLNIEDVTKQVKAAVKDGAPTAQTLQQRNAAISRIEQDCAAKAAGTRCSVVTLFSGGRYDLYQYKSYTDIRMVFAPEAQLAFFGGDRDSITYLRYGMDVAFLRAYENNRPADTPHYLKWSSEGVKDGDVVFASGNPQGTSRLWTSAQLAFYRDRALPLTLSRLQSRIQALSTFAAKSDENLRAAQPVLTAFLTTYKLAAGKLIGLRDDRLIARKTVFEGKIRHSVERDAKIGAQAGKVWDEIDAAYKAWTPFERPYQLLEESPAPGSNLFRIARAQVRHEKVTDNETPITPVDESLEVLLVTQYLEELNRLDEKDIPLKAILGGKTAAQAAEAYVKAGVTKPDEGMLHLAMLLEPAAQRLRKQHQQNIESLETSAAEKIAGYRFRLFGAAEYPDASGTPRLEYGVVKGYTDRAGVAQPYADTFSGLYYRRNNEGPYQVPQRWVDLKPSLEVVTPLDFVSTCDIGGGDHGGPVVNRSGELVGVTFDGNLESLPDTYLYTDEQARAVHVAAQGIVEALRKAYKATALLQELGL
jgi:Peptidase S46